MMNRDREYNLLFALSYVLVADHNVDFKEPFFTVLGVLALEIAINVVLSMMFYVLILRPIYNWLTKND